MRHGGIFVLTFLLGCAAGTVETVHTRVPGPDEGAPAGGNGNHVAVADETDDGAGDDTTADAGTSLEGVDEILVSGHGFMPMVITRTGPAGATTTGSRDGSELDPSCIGTFPTRPQHVIKLGGQLDVLRVLVDTPSSDLTLAIRTADGVWHCNDDSGDPQNGLNPTVELYSPPPGQIEVWVGVYSSYYSGAQYSLGVTEQYGYASDFLRH